MHAAVEPVRNFSVLHFRTMTPLRFYAFIPRTCYSQVSKRIFACYLSAPYLLGTTSIFPDDDSGARDIPYVFLFPSIDHRWVRIVHDGYRLNTTSAENECGFGENLWHYDDQCFFYVHLQMGIGKLNNQYQNRKSNR
jgi:hypothetical protein